MCSDPLDHASPLMLTGCVVLEQARDLSVSVIGSKWMIICFDALNSRLQKEFFASPFTLDDKLEQSFLAFPTSASVSRLRGPHGHSACVVHSHKPSSATPSRCPSHCSLSQRNTFGLKSLASLLLILVELFVVVLRITRCATLCRSAWLLSTLPLVPSETFTDASISEDEYWAPEVQQCRMEPPCSSTVKCLWSVLIFLSQDWDVHASRHSTERVMMRPCRQNHKTRTNTTKCRSLVATSCLPQMIDISTRQNSACISQNVSHSDLQEKLGIGPSVFSFVSLFTIPWT